MNPRDVVVVAGVRTPFVKAGTEFADVSAVELGRAGLQVRTSDYGAFCRDIAVLARQHGIRLREVLPADESLESVFAYLVAS